MRRILFWLPILLATSVAPPANAQAPLNILGAESTATIATTGAFSLQSVLSQSSGRVSCRIQFKGPGPTGYVFFGTAAPTTTASGFQLTKQQTITCDEVDGAVEGNSVWLSGTANDTFEIKVK
jgi:hypothetical protein